MASLPARSVLVAEVLVRPDDSPLRKNGSGMLLLNPPFGFDAGLRRALPALGRAVADDPPAPRVDWLRAPA
jgi:23S rRNA (adenine2030-N6)-methyltransferase